MDSVWAHHLDERGLLVRSAPGELRGVALEERKPPSPPVAYHGRKSVVTWWWSATTRTQVACGSLRRMRVAIGLDWDPSVAWFSGEPVELRWQTTKGRRRRWRPDFIARTTDGDRIVVAVEPEKPDQEWRDKLVLLHTVAAEAGWRVEVRQVPHGVRRNTLEWLAEYRGPDPIEDEAACEQALLRAFAEPRTLIDGARASGIPELLALDHAYRLIWRHRLHIDWDAPLLPTARAWAAA
ncbi:TnsA-like heteromeric transposase endonuclease subunit [Streptomyces sp. NPDC046977]|uniref:TnsA-like heteromeric transposase endonuclease subunit n=1 Tax=Streptomyces sp. NPDC046977 TaxID=3154703 RepID=UPI00340F8A9A